MPQFTAPVNQEYEHHHPPPGHGGDHALAASQALQGAQDVWATLSEHITNFHAEGDDDDKDKERRRRILAKIIDAVISYHLVDSDEPLTGRELADNSSVATHLHTDWKKLNDGQHWRVKVNQKLLPPGLELNYYSRVVRPDVEASNGLLHAIKFPLLPPPSILQALYFGTPYLSGSTAALGKSGGLGYLSLPHTSSGNHSHFSAALHGEDEHRHRPHGYPGPGTSASTFFVPGNTAWAFLPAKIRLFLLSPWGERWVSALFMLHALPHDVVFADSIHHVKAHKASPKVGEQIDVAVPLSVVGAAAGAPPAPVDWHMPKMPKIPGLPGQGDDGEHPPPPPPHPPKPPHGPPGHDGPRRPPGGPHPPPPPPHAPPHDGEPHRPPGHRGNVTHYRFDSVLPKIDWKKWEEHRRNRHRHGDDEGEKDLLSFAVDDKHHFEKVNVDVWRYHILPGGRGPLQTRVVVQGNAVWAQDIPAANGALHVIGKFILPEHLKDHHGKPGKDHKNKEAQQNDDGVATLWRQIAAEAEHAGFGKLSPFESARLGL